MSQEFLNIEKINILKDRSNMLKKVRSFFYEKNLIEIDPPYLTKNPSIDEHIDVITARVSEQKVGYLHTSPEYSLKKLLSSGIKDCFFLGHVFRKNENGSLHNIEFTMAEWYRINISYEDFIEEIMAFIRLFLPNLSYIKKSFKQTFLDFCNIDITKEKKEDLIAYIKLKEIDISFENLTKDDLLNIILSHVIEPNLGQNEIYVIDKYPPSMAALSEIVEEKNEKVAMRFEFYFKGIELGNGFYELRDSKEQEKRLLNSNEKRKKMKKEPLPIDEKFIKAIDKLPSSFGIAMGFDRLMMLRSKKNNINDIISFNFENS